MAKDLDTQVEAFRSRPLDAGPYTFVAADALVLKVRENGRVVSVHTLVAVGVNAEGYREILGVDVTSSEDGAGWLAFFRSLVARGLSGVRLVTSDAHAGLVAAIGGTLSGAAWQHVVLGGMAVTGEGIVALGEDVAALGLRPTRRGFCSCPIRSNHRRTVGEAAEGRRPPRRSTTGPVGVHRISQADLETDLEQQSAGAPQ